MTQTEGIKGLGGMIRRGGWTWVEVWRLQILLSERSPLVRGTPFWLHTLCPGPRRRQTDSNRPVRCSSLMLESAVRLVMSRYADRGRRPVFPCCFSIRRPCVRGPVLITGFYFVIFVYISAHKSSYWCNDSEILSGLNVTAFKRLWVVCMWFPVHPL